MNRLVQNLKMFSKFLLMLVYEIAVHYMFSGRSDDS